MHFVGMKIENWKKEPGQALKYWDTVSYLLMLTCKGMVMNEWVWLKKYDYDSDASLELCD